ncbi:MAG: hypothetical protein Tp1125DCM00d2C21254131_35 [Prokaryotic dsDNA virus sp.]|nr:MAG: hypothetical protein Tp1125DCM00d2C21254131_35 [Prokaryotic dsDNA virus sp.]|tara:strand:- start:1200 stop:1622 length:423 start_codon:yes stop_codon:yes gene_type:complete
MSFTAIEANKLLDEEKITKTEIEALVSLRSGGIAKDVEDSEEFQSLKAMGLVQLIPLSHPRSTLSIPAYVPSEAGVTMLNEIDKRYRRNSDKSVRAWANAPEGVKEKTVRTPIDKDTPVAVAEASTKKKARKIVNEKKDD